MVYTRGYGESRCRGKAELRYHHKFVRKYEAPQLDLDQV